MIKLYLEVKDGLAIVTSRRPTANIINLNSIRNELKLFKNDGEERKRYLVTELGGRQKTETIRGALGFSGWKNERDSEVRQ